MNNNIVIEILKYLDFFGTKFNFYTEKSRKLYTPLGGILTLLSIIFGIIIFIFINIDNFLHNVPNSTTSIMEDNYRKIKFKDEKIWIPWRISDFWGKTINHSDFFYPIIYYYKGVKNDSTKGIDLSYEIINYKLCNETSMINNSDNFILDMELDQLYCIDMEELDMGGSWDYDYINYITFDLYTCKNGIDYDKNNPNCTSYQKFSDAIKEYNCFEFDMYYPVIHYQPTNKSSPISIKYNNYFYHLSRFSNKIDRIYLQQNILNDDNGWIIKDKKSLSYWGCVLMSGDSYSTRDERDLMNEGSTSRLYSFNIYLNSDIIYYNRSYKKLLLIIADGLPIVNVIIIFFKTLAKIFKISSGNKKMTELLFENLKEKKYFLKLKSDSDLSPKKVKKTETIFQNKLNNNTTISKNNDFSFFHTFKQEPDKKIKYDTSKKSVISRNNNHNYGHKLKYVKNANDKKEIHKKIILNRHTLKNSIEINDNISEENKKINVNCNVNSNIDDNLINKINDMSNLPFSYSINIKNKLGLKEKKNTNNANNHMLKIKKTSYIKKSLFPYKYYLCTIFIKNFDISKKSLFFPQKFIIVYNFICQLFDISSYLILQKEFQIMKNTMMVEYKDILEKGGKINVNDKFFNIDMKECLDSRKFSILGKVKHSKGEIN